MSDGTDEEAGGRHARPVGSDPDAPAVPNDEAETVAIPVVRPMPPRVAEPLGPSSTPAPSTPAPSTPPSSAPPTLSTGSVPWRTVALIAGVVVAVCSVAYAADWFSSSDRVPRGVTVAGVELGGKGFDDAEAMLRDNIGPRADAPVPVQAGDVTTEVVPGAAGLNVDWAATMDRVGSQPVSPFTRIASFFTHREVGLTSTVDPVALTAATQALTQRTDRDPVEGTIVFEGATPRAVPSVTGQHLEVEAAGSALADGWALGAPVELPVTVDEVTVTQDGLNAALTDVAEKAVSAPVVVQGDRGVTAALQPDQVGAVLTFAPDGSGGLTPAYNFEAARGIFAPALVPTETQPVDARFTFETGRPTVVPSVDGHTVQWPETLADLPGLFTGESRTVAAVYAPSPAAFTTEAAQGLGVNEVIAEYTTGGFEYASGVNIGITARIVNGALVKPGDTFSLNGFTGPRGPGQGFVESGIINNGRPDRAIGGGISQFATTLYNAGYFGGMEDVEHTEHSYYISRYPEAREATVFEGAIDLKFRNPAATGVVIESFATGSEVTVRLWGTPTVEVESITGDRVLPTTPNTVTLPRGDDCVASGGAGGFTASNTRVITDIASGQEISRQTRTVKYDPVPIVRCE